METTRQQKFAKQIQRDISDILQKHGKDYYGNAFVTVTKINVTSDLGLARVNLSLFQSKEPEKVLEQIRRHKGDIRRLLGNSIKDTIHHIPDLDFYIDTSLDDADKMDQLLKGLVIPPVEATKLNEDDYKDLGEV